MRRPVADRECACHVEVIGVLSVYSGIILLGPSMNMAVDLRQKAICTPTLTPYLDLIMGN